MSGRVNEFTAKHVARPYMRFMRRLFLTTALMAMLATPALASDDRLSDDRLSDERLSDDAEELGREMEKSARDAARSMLGVLQLFMSRIPQYQAPEVLENGDIIIRRKRGSPSEPPRPPERPGPRRGGDVTDL